MAQARNRRQYYPSELGAATSCPPSSEGAGRKRTPAMGHRAVLRPYLHGMEQAMKQGKYTQGKPLLVRYADDFVIFHPNQEELQLAADLVTTWLKDMGLH